jgi:FtsH-binding integral membrane protein
MRKSLKVSRGVQLAGCALVVMGIVSCSTRGDPSTMSRMFLVGFVAIIGARVYEWLTKE